MILKRFYDDKLAQASFLIGCGKSGEACIIDPNRDIEQYIEAAASEGLKIKAVTETHIHADFVSGSRELAEKTGARLYLSDEGDADWKYGFANQPNVTLVLDGDRIRIGNVRLDVIKTPGHTPEHISFLLTDEASSPQPLGAFTGDFIFVGDVGRPDLLERAAGFEGTMEKGARILYKSLTDFKKMPDTLILWPSHGSGSACGKNLGGVPISTLGYEKNANWAFRAPDEQTFTATVLQGQPDPPAYFKHMKRINRDGPPILGPFRMPRSLEADQIIALLGGGATVIDIRPTEEVASGFIPGTITIALGKSFPNWAGWLTPYDQPVYLLGSKEAVEEAAKDLRKIGLDNIGGWFGQDALAHCQQHGKIETIGQISATDAASRSDAAILDVRSASEYSEGHIPEAINIPLGHLQSRIAEVPNGRHLIVHCQGGTRSPIAASLLAKLGRPGAINMTDGFMDWESRGLPIERT